MVYKDDLIIVEDDVIIVEVDEEALIIVEVAYMYEMM